MESEQIPNIHIHAPPGEFIAQIRLRGHRLWEAVGEPFADAKAAMIAAVQAMGPNHKRARVLFCAELYDPNVVMELNR